MKEIEEQTQLSKQESKLLKKDPIACFMLLVPKLDEKEDEKHFLVFEKVSKSMSYLFLQSVLSLARKPKAVYCVLSVSQSVDYGLVKERILQCCML